RDAVADAGGVFPARAAMAVCEGRSPALQQKLDSRIPASNGRWARLGFGVASAWARRAKQSPGRMRPGLRGLIWELLRLVHGDAATLALSGLLCFCLLHAEGFVHPVIGSFQIFGSSRGVIAFDVGPLAVHQVHVRHGVVVIRTKLDGLIQAVDSFLN